MSSAEDAVYDGDEMLQAPIASEAAAMGQPVPELPFNPFSQPVDKANVLPNPNSSSAGATTGDTAKGDAAAGDAAGERQIKETEALYTPYAPKSDGPQHPSPLISTSTLIFAMPELDHEVLHEALKTSDALSAAQRDAITMATMAAHKGKAMLIGDGTGVGKGRELFGVMFNHLKWNPSSRKFLFITASATLENDAGRDLAALGWPRTGKRGIPLFSIGNYKANDAINLDSGIMFCTYATLRQPASAKGVKKPHRSRLAQILEWLGDDFDGFIAFDEIHNAKDVKTSTAKAVIDLQSGVLSSNVVYASATSMSSVGHLSALTRLGLWDYKLGDNTSYANLAAFMKKWQNQTRSGLEVVSSELAAQGLYIARRLSFEGTTFRTSIAELTTEQCALHEQLCIWWVTLCMNDEVLQGREHRSYLYNAHLRFFKALLIAFRVKHCAQRVKLALDAGGSAVISLIGTGEAVAKRVIEEKGDEAVEDGFVALQEVMRSVVKRAIESVQVCPQIIRQLAAQVDGFELPPSPLDLLIAELSNLGHGRVIEMTGRDFGFYRGADGKWTKAMRSPSLNAKGCAAFQAGRAKMAIISQAASTGISLHNTVSGPDCPRTQFMLELPWAAQDGMQQLGRTHRSDQHNAPTYELITSNLNAEKRFAATIAKRAADLGAATTGDRRGANERDAFGSDVLVGSDAQQGVLKMFNALSDGSVDWPIWVTPEQRPWPAARSEVSKAFALMGLNSLSPSKQCLGRLLGMPLDLSNQCMHVFESACIEAHMQSVKASGDIGVEDVVVDASGKTKVVAETANGAVTIATDIGVTYEQVRHQAESWAASGGVDAATGKPRNRWKLCTRDDKRLGRRFNCYAQLEEPRVRILRPNGRTAQVYFRDFIATYGAIKDEATAKQLWDEEYALCLNQCSHGPNCKVVNCEWGKRFVNSTIVKMPGALNALSEYTGSRQILRFNNTLMSDQCVAVRLGTDRNPVEEKLGEERRRADAIALKATQSKQKVIDALEEREAMRELAGALSDDEDEAEEGGEGSDFIAHDDSDDDEGVAGVANDSDEESLNSDDDDSDDDASSAGSVGSKRGRSAPTRAAAAAVKAKMQAALSDGDESDGVSGYGSDSRAPPSKKRGSIASGKARAAPSAQSPTGIPPDSDED